MRVIRRTFITKNILKPVLKQTNVPTARDSLAIQRLSQSSVDSAHSHDSDLDCLRGLHWHVCSLQACSTRISFVQRASESSWRESAACQISVTGVDCRSVLPSLRLRDSSLDPMTRIKTHPAVDPRPGAGLQLDGRRAHCSGRLRKHSSRCQCATIKVLRALISRALSLSADHDGLVVSVLPRCLHLQSRAHGGCATSTESCYGWTRN
jgi:hypothetical protein